MRVGDLTPASHQTIKLGSGRHRRPEDGACVMELASMLAHEPFSHRPESVCPVIAGFLRSYNDHMDPERRQDLYRYAARAVGTRSDAATERARGEMCLRWARETCNPPPLRVRILHRLLACQGPEFDGVYAARAAVATQHADFAHRRALALLNKLIAVGAGREDLDIPAESELRLPEPLAKR
jgi:hypothetical protein